MKVRNPKDIDPVLSSILGKKNNSVNTPGKNISKDLGEEVGRVNVEASKQLQSPTNDNPRVAELKAIRESGGIGALAAMYDSAQVAESLVTEIGGFVNDFRDRE